ncbi:MAG TPA: Ni/Fe hydrogenase subunit alpha [Spirochaetota bacterium]|mgnify:FL=1|jgi:NAD-reducing hydrogenase large subunit|nr:Ni/Fe hydrogenase subunit alpha [Spirochaetota bacterium]HOQ12011.1 Ni/Fe hydrogenase subunit alpha [Spirochaetota bacterium]HPD78141.1 Ni/Fe hydrogenase subunit alpha [Spirochaetota bacterium]HRS63519.1 Ni/Fe hydrogenase subunit alpha [Spirochaetota bacterium]HRU65135.1 Ni/Fe hydrogenase subunit alpha [Spirochaetota bacterium]
MGRKITIEPVTRVEGHGKVTIQLDDAGNVSQTRLHIVEFRGFEKFVQGRPYWEAPVLVQRLCGICPVSHHLAAAKAMDVIVGAGTGDGLTPTAEKMRRLMHYGQMFQSHALHFFHLASPDLLFGADGDVATRNVIGVALAHKDLAVQGVLMRKFGQEIILATAGKKIHGTGAIPGGINKNLSIEERDKFLKGPDPLNADKMVEWAQGALDFFKSYHAKNKDYIDNFSVFPSSHLSLVRKDGAMDLYHGVIRCIDKDGNKILNDIDYQDYYTHIGEEVRSWSYMKFPYIRKIGMENGWYTVGPLARCNTADFIPTPLAQKEFEIFKAYTNGKPNHMSMHMHWARLIELLHSAEVIRDLLKDPDLQKDDLVVKGTKKKEGVGLIEAPRGTLFHHYRINDLDQIEMANLIVSTTNNNEPMNRGVNYVAKANFTGKKEITEGMMNRVEMVIRAYDPCLSCATHALGQMPLEVTLVDSEGSILAQRRK